MDWLNGNKELPLWGEVLALFCQSYISFKLGVASWLPLVAPNPLRPTDDPIQLMIDWRDKFDSVVLASLEQNQAGRAKSGDHLSARARAASMFAMW